MATDDGTPHGPLTVSLLGPLQAARGGQPIAIPGIRPTTVLAVLASAAGRVVPITSLLDALWDDDPGDNAEAAVRVYVVRLRKAVGLGPDSRSPISTWGSGYRLDVSPGAIDVETFEMLRRRAAESLHQGDPVGAERHLDEALQLWRGPALAGLPPTRFVSDLAHTLSEHRLAAVELRMDARLSLGRFDDVVTEAKTLVRDNPFRESLTERLMIALYRSRRQAEALDAFTALRGVLDDELGLEPSPALRELQRRVLQQDATLDAAPVHARDDEPEPTERSPSEVAAIGHLIVDADRSVAVTHTPWTIGRSAACDLVLANGQVSRRHAHIVLIEERPTVVDLGSTNGTQVDGRPVTSQPLTDGCILTVGGHSLEFRAPPG